MRATDRFAPLFPLLLAGLLLAFTPVEAAGFSLADIFGRQERASFSVGFGRAHPFDEDMQNTYGGLSVWGVRLAIPVEQGVDGLFGVSYSHDHGDPYYDIWAFESEEGSQLTIVPLEFGLRVHPRSSKGHRVNLGLLFQEIWAREEIFQGQERDDSQEASLSGWGWGVEVFVGPEWFFADHRYSLGFELSATARTMEFRTREIDRSLSLSAFEWRAFFSRRL